MTTFSLTVRMAGLMQGLAVVAVIASTPAFAGPVENLERERARLLSTLMQGDLTPEEADRQALVSTRRLVDLERMVLRDDSVANDRSAATRRALANYDLTFLVHASTEANRTILDHWMASMGLTTDALQNARPGRR